MILPTNGAGITGCPYTKKEGRKEEEGGGEGDQERNFDLSLALNIKT